MKWLQSDVASRSTRHGHVEASWPGCWNGFCGDGEIGPDK